MNLRGAILGGPDLLGSKLAVGQIGTHFGSEFGWAYLGGSQICWGCKLAGGRSALSLEVKFGGHFGGGRSVWGQIGTHFGSKFGGGHCEG